MNDKIIKKNICNKWIENKCRFMNNPELCEFAHGESDIIKNKCLNDIYCWNEDCDYIHLQEWNPSINKKECLRCINGYCDKKNKRYKHINNINKDIKEVSKDNILEIPKDVDFPDFTKKYDINKNIYKYKYSDVIKSNLINKKKN